MKDIWLKHWRKILVVIIVLFVATIPFMHVKKYYINLLCLTMIWTIMTSGLNVIQGFTGYVSIAQSSFLGIGAYTSALLVMRLGWSFWVALPVSVVFSAVAGLLIGYPSLRTKGHYFSIITMAFCIIVWRLMVVLRPLTNGENGLTVPAPSKFFMKSGNYYYLLLIFTLATLAFVYLIINSRVGRAFKTIRENEELAQAVGIPIAKYKIIAFVISAALGGLAGSLYGHYIHYVGANMFTTEPSMNAILATIMGGSGTFTGPIIGSFILQFLPEYLRFMADWRMAIFGLILILLTIYMPKGLVHLVKLLFELIKRKLVKPNT